MLIVPMLEEAEGLRQRLAFLFVDRAAGCIGDAGGLAQILVSVVEAAELRPLTDDDVHGHSITGHLVLTDDK